MKIICTHCGHSLDVAAGVAVERQRCPSCRWKLTAPAPEAPAAVATATQPAATTATTTQAESGQRKAAARSEPKKKLSWREELAGLVSPAVGWTLYGILIALLLLFYPFSEMRLAVSAARSRDRAVEAAEAWLTAYRLDGFDQVHGQVAQAAAHPRVGDDPELTQLLERLVHQRLELLAADKLVRAATARARGEFLAAEDLYAEYLLARTGPEAEVALDELAEIREQQFPGWQDVGPVFLDR